MCKSVNMEVSGGQYELLCHVRLVHFLSQKKRINRAYQNNSFYHNTNLLQVKQRRL